MAEQSANTMRSVDRAFDVIEVLEDADGPLRLSEVSRRCGLHVATTQRILAALERRGRVEHSDAGFTVGVASVLGVSSFTSTNRLVAEVRPVMQVLSSATGLPVSLHLRWGWSRVIVDRVGDEAERFSPSIGRKLPLHLGAAKVIAAYLPLDEREVLIQRVGSFSRADGRVVTEAEHRAELEQIRRQGYATSSQDRIPGRFSVGAPVQTSFEIWNAALVIGGRNVMEHSADIPELALAVREAAGELSARRLQRS